MKNPSIYLPFWLAWALCACFPGDTWFGACPGDFWGWGDLWGCGDLWAGCCEPCWPLPAGVCKELLLELGAGFGCGADEGADVMGIGAYPKRCNPYNIQHKLV